MKKCIVTVARLNKRNAIPPALSSRSGIMGVVLKGFSFDAEEVIPSDAALGKWYKDRDQYFYWGGGLSVLDETEQAVLPEHTDNNILEAFSITPAIKTKIQRVVNVFETGKADGNYAALVKYADHKDPVSKAMMVQITYGRSQTTEFGHLPALVRHYIDLNGIYAGKLQPYLGRLGRKPSLAGDEVFCDTLKKAGKEDPVMAFCQDSLFESKYYQPAYQWFAANGFTQPLSLLVIYDSYIHSGGVLAFLRKRFPTAVPSQGGAEKSWIINYVDARHEWLRTHSSSLLQKTVYRTACFKEQIGAGNWGLQKPLKANGITVQ